MKKAKQKSKRKVADKKPTVDLLNQVVTLTGLPSRHLKRELAHILERKNLDIHNLTVDQLRSVVATYLRQIMGGLLERYSPRRRDLPH